MKSEEFRLIREEDIDAYYDVIHEGYRALKQYPINFAAIDESKEDALEWIRDVPTFGLYESGRLASVMSFEMPWGPYRLPEEAPSLGRVATHPDFKHQGLATKLYDHLEKEIIIGTYRAPMVTLGTAANHPWLPQMYESWGFAPYKTVHFEGKVHSTVLMKKVLGRIYTEKRSS